MTTKDLINDNRNKIEGINEMTTEEILQSMLKTNTGVALCDSGGSDGRHWQKNQGRDFENEPEVTVEKEWLKEGDEITFTISLYHFLKNNLTTDELTDEFNSRFEVMEDWDGWGYGLSEKASEWLVNTFPIRIEYLSDRWLNSYNYESSLSQVIQYRYIGDGYVLLQIRNGCDVRGGYTDAKLFKLNSEGLWEGVYGMIIYPDGRGVDVDGLNGYCLTTEDGVKVLYEKGMIIDLYLVEC